MVKDLKQLAICLVWMHEGWGNQFHAEQYGLNKIQIWHNKSKDFAFAIDLNNRKSIQEAINIMRCWG